MNSERPGDHVAVMVCRPLKPGDSSIDSPVFGSLTHVGDVHKNEQDEVGKIDEPTP